MLRCDRSNFVLDSQFKCIWYSTRQRLAEQFGEDGTSTVRFPQKLALNMRTNVTFWHPAGFVGDLEDGGGVLAVNGAQWFAALLRQIPGLQLDEDLCQEDWGVVFFARREQKRFWIGLSVWDSKGAWVAHFHHGSFDWLQWFSPSGKNGLMRLLADFHVILASEPAIANIAWHDEREMIKPEPASFPTPVEG